MEDFLEYLSNVFENYDFRKLIFPTVIILLYIIGFVYLFTLIHNNKVNNNIKVTSNDDNKKSSEFIYVDVKGSVETPGVYKLNSDSRVIDAIEASGGITEDANTRFINLSKLLNDGDVVVVYSNTEIENAKKDNIIYIDTPCVCEEVKNDACYKEDSSSGKVNINTANIDELKSLDGIGDAKANAIIKYRTENGNFKSIEDINNVSGISESLYSKIKENITVWYFILFIISFNNCIFIYIF